MSKTPEDYLRLQQPNTGRMFAEDGTVVNQAESIRRNLLGIWRSEYPGAGPFNSHGEREVTGEVYNNALWAGAATLPDPLSSGVAMSIVSTNAADAAAGAGARLIYIEYLNNSLRPAVTVVPTNGLTPVLTPAEDIRWIQNMLVVGADLTGTRAAVGTITASYGGVVYATIPAKNLDTASSFRMVPNGYKAYVSNVLLSSISTTADAKALIRTVIWNDGLLIPSSGIGVQNNSFTIQLVTGSHALLPGMILGLSVTSNKSLTATGSFIGWVEPYGS